MRKVEAGCWRKGALPYAYLCEGFVALQKMAAVSPQGRLHDLRHTVVCDLLDQGVDPKRVAAHVGDTLETILDTYRKLRPKKDQLALSMALGRRGTPIQGAERAPTPITVQ